MSCLYEASTVPKPCDGPFGRSGSTVNEQGPLNISRAVRWLTVALGLFLPCVAVDAQSPFNLTFGAPIPVNTPSATLSIPVTVSTDGSVDRIRVVTAGADSLDFAASGTSACASNHVTATQVCNQSVIFTPTVPGIRMGAVLLVDDDKGVIGTAFISGAGLGGVPVLLNGNLIPVAGSGAWDPVNDGVAAISGNLNLPAGVALDGAGNMYIADSAHNRIRKVLAAAPHTISTIAGNGNPTYTGDGDDAKDATLNTPTGVAVDGAGNIYIADSGNNVIRKIDPTGTITTIAGNGQVGDSSHNDVGDGGPAKAANLNQPWGVTVDPAGNLYIADTLNHRIRMVDLNTKLISTVAGKGTINTNGSGAYSGDGGLATLAELNHPFAVAFDATGNMFIPDAGNNRIRKVDTTGTISTYAGTGAIGFTGDGNLATKATLWGPSGVVADVHGNVYIADTQNNAIRKVNADSKFISTVVQTGIRRNVFNNVLYGNSLYGPIGLAIDGNGNIYVADYFWMRVREIQNNVTLADFTGNPVRQGDVSTLPSIPPSETVENDGNGSLTLSGVNAGSNAAVNSSATTCISQTQLAAGSACTVVAQFAPTTFGNPLFGDVNVADQAPVNAILDIKLVGNAIPVNATTVKLISSTNPSNFGQIVTYTATVSTGSGTGALTGTVTFSDGTTTLQAAVPVTLASTDSTTAYYTAIFSTPALAVGSHTISATYSGDAKHFANPDPGDPTAVPVTVTQIVNEQTATTLSSSANPSALGSSLTLTAKVAIFGGGGITPDGVVTFKDAGTVIGGGSLDANGVATLTTTSLASGLHAISAIYGGDSANYILGSTSAILSQDVQAASTTVVTSSPNPSTYGTSVTFVASVSSASGVAATGTVTFLDGSTKLGTVTLAGTTGTGTFSTSSLTAGSHAITATYAGDQNAGPGTSSPIIQVVNLTSTITTLAANPNPGIAGKAVALTATVTVTTGSAAVTGTITFTDGGTTIGTANLNSAGVASINPILPPGAHAIVATYGGDSNDNGSASAAVPLAVNLATTMVTVASSASPTIVLAPVTFTATVVGNGGTPKGSVTFFADGASIAQVALGANGTATATDSALAVGNHAVTASYSGDTLDSPSNSATLTQAVQAISTSTGLASASSGGTAPQLILVATITGGSGPVPTGTVTFTSGTQTIGVATVDGTGIATLVPDLASTSYSIIASYSGDAVHSPSSSAAVKITGTPVGFGISITPATLTIESSQNANLNITLSSNNGYADKIGLGCGTLPSGVTCHFSSNTADLKAGATTTVQLNIDTNLPLGGGTTAKNTTGAESRFSLAGLFLPAGLLFGCIFWRSRKRHPAVFGAVLALLLSGAFLMTGCGGFTQRSAAAGTYTIQISGVGSASNISHYQNITLTIEK